QLAERAAEVERLGVSILVEEIGPVLPGREAAERAVRMAQAKAARVGGGLVAVRQVAEEVALDVGRQVATAGRGTRGKRQPSLARMQRHLVLLVRACVRAYRDEARAEHLVADALDARALVAQDRVELDIAAQRDGRIGSGQPERRFAFGVGGAAESAERGGDGDRRAGFHDAFQDRAPRSWADACLTAQGATCVPNRNSSVFRE